MSDKPLRKDKLQIASVDADSAEKLMSAYVTAGPDGRLTIGRKIRSLRKKLEIGTQKDLADEAGVNVETISRIENGANVEVDTLAKVLVAIYTDMVIEFPAALVRDHAPPPAPETTVTETEQTLLDAFRSLPEGDRLEILAYADYRKQLAQPEPTKESSEHAAQTPPVTKRKARGTR